MGHTPTFSTALDLALNLGLQVLAHCRTPAYRSGCNTLYAYDGPAGPLRSAILVADCGDLELLTNGGARPRASAVARLAGIPCATGYTLLAFEEELPFIAPFGAGLYLTPCEVVVVGSAAGLVALTTPSGVAWARCDGLAAGHRYTDFVGSRVSGAPAAAEPGREQQ